MERSGVAVLMRSVVTGGAGFIGAEVVRQLALRGDAVMVIDALTYAACPDALQDLDHVFVEADVCDDAATSAVERHQPDVIIHAAAESHVDRSIDGAARFVHTNIEGTYRMLEAARRTGARFVQVSTDEVYGSLGSEGVFDEASPYAPRSPYAASKAAADHLVGAWHATHGVHTVVTHGCNTYGPWQHPEKLVPLMIMKALSAEPLPVYGDGSNVRQWLHASDHARGIIAACDGEPGQRYNLGSSDEMTNIDLVRKIAALAQTAHGAAPSKVTFVEDRPGHDFRYALDSTRAKAALGWSARVKLEDGLRDTVAWYVAHRSSWQKLIAFRGERLGAPS